MTGESPIDILGLTSDEFIPQAAQRGVRRPNAIALYRDAFRHGRAAADWISLDAAPIAGAVNEHGTIKFVQRYGDGLETESVILPYVGSTGRRRLTLCVSSQIGCAMGCTFCETAQMGLMRNLAAAQIVGQWFAAQFHSTISPPRQLAGGAQSEPIAKSPRGQMAGSAASIANIVFMGMGEPMDNLDAVIQAIRVLCDINGPGIAPARISVSTVGRAAGILKLAEFAGQSGYHKLRLAVSINAPNDAIRSQIMPINRATPMVELMHAMLAWPSTNAKRLLIEYVLIPGVNDALQHADELCAYLRPLNCTVNVIPYNPRRNSPWPAPSEEEVWRFIERLRANGQFVKRRQTLGRSVMAACGQLGNAAIRRRKLVQLAQTG